MTAEEFEQSERCYEHWNKYEFAEAYAKHENDHLLIQLEGQQSLLDDAEKENEELKGNLLTYEEKMELMDFTIGTDLYQTVDLLFVKQALKE